VHREHVHSSNGLEMRFGMTLLVALCAAALVLYLGAYVRERARAKRWSALRTLSFVGGMGLTIASLLPPLAHRAHEDLSAHMYQHLCLGMFAPIAIVLGKPVTLMLRALPAHAARRAVRLLHGAPVRWLRQPVSALFLNVGGMAVLYLTPLYAWMGTYGALHTLVHVHFLAAGCLFSWSILQLEPAGPERWSAPARLTVLFVAIAAHATVAKVMYAHGFPRGTAHAAAELERAAQVMYYGGDLAELVLLVALFMRWPRPVR
jgi:putative membrane protein